MLFYRILLVSLYLLVGIPSLYAREIDNSLLDANVTRYRSLLAEIEKKDGGDPLQRALQQALLKRLILLEETPTPSLSLLDLQLFHAPGNEANLRRLFGQILEKAQLLSKLQAEIRKENRELKTLKRDLSLSSGGGKKDHMTLQLQYTYTYKKHQWNLTQEQRLRQAFEALPDHINALLENIEIRSKSLDQELRSIKQQLQGLKRNETDLTLERERLRLLGDQEKLRQIEQGLQSIQAAKKELLKRQAEDQTLLYLLALKNRDKKAFILVQGIQQSLKAMGLPLSAVTHISDLLLTAARQRLGITAALQNAAGTEISHTADLLWKRLNAPIFTLGESPISPIKILLALSIFILGILVGVFYKRGISRIDSHNLTEATKTLLANMGYYFIVIIAFFIALHYLGINLSSIALVAGALSVGIGFGLQNIVSNFVSGIILMFERSIKIGDYIELDENLKGRVTDVRMRSITVTTNANIDIIVPNQELIQNRVVNWTMNDKIRRFEIPFSVAYGTEVSKVISTVLEAVGRSGYEDVINTPDRSTQVIMTGMGDSSVDFTLFVWIKGPKTLRPKRTISRFLILIYNALYEAGIEIPFPQRDLHIRSVDTPLPVFLGDSGKPHADSIPPLDKA